MHRNSDIFRQILRVFLGESFCILLMLGVYLLLDKFTTAVLLGASLGGAIAIGNFAALSMVVARAADMAAETGEAAKAKFSVQSSAVVRLLVVAGLYILLLKSGKCDPIASLLPLIFVQLSITVSEFFRKGGKTHGNGA